MNIEHAILAFKRKDTPTSQSTNNYATILLNGHALFLTVQKLTKFAKDRNEKEVKAIAANQFLANTVTSLEVFFKTIISEGECWEKAGIERLLKEPITLNLAFDLFENGKVSKEYIIGHSRTFQNIGFIKSVFNELLGCNDFFKEIQGFKIKFPGTTDIKSIGEKYPGWQPSLKEIYDARHSFIHEGILTNLTTEKSNEYLDTVIYFMLIVGQYLNDRGVKLKARKTTK